MSQTFKVGKKRLGLFLVTLGYVQTVMALKLLIKKSPLCLRQAALTNAKKPPTSLEVPCGKLHLRPFTLSSFPSATFTHTLV